MSRKKEVGVVKHLHMPNRSITFEEKGRFKMYFGAKLTNLLRSFYQIWLVVIYMQFLCPGDH